MSAANKKNHPTWPAKRVYHDRVDGVSKSKGAAQPGDSVVILYRPKTDIPLLTEKVRGVTSKALIATLRRGMERILNPGDTSHIHIAYTHIGNHLDPRDRLRLVHNFETGKLRPRDLVGDHWVAHSFERNGTLWHYAYDV